MSSDDVARFLKHDEVLQESLRLNELRDYKAALTAVREAIDLQPKCAVARYNEANTFSNLRRSRKAARLFLRLAWSEDLSDCVCVTSIREVHELRMDAYFMLFVNELYGAGNWKRALSYLRIHLQRRRRHPNAKSLFSKASVLKRAEKLRRACAPSSLPIRDLLAGLV